MIRPGSHILFDLKNQSLLERQWYSARIEPSLRFMIITAGMLYHELGVSRVRVLKLLGNTKEELENRDTPHYYGAAADISIRELIDNRVTDIDEIMTRRFANAKFVSRRLNSLFPFGQGEKKSAIHNVSDGVNIGHIHLECPIGGFKRETQILATWKENGCDGNPKQMR